MIVGQPPPPTARPQPNGTQPPRPAGEAPARLFAKLVRAEPLLMDTADGLAFTSNGRDFRGTVSVGEDAIRFDARPIVAPAHLSTNDELAAPAVGSAPPARSAAMPEALGASSEQSLSAPIGGFSDVIDGAEPDSKDGSAPRGVTGPERIGKAIGTPSAGVSAGRGVASDAATAGPAGSRPVAPAARAAATVSQAKPPASVIVSPQDVLVVVHGIALSAAEQKTLLHDVRELLSAHGLSDRAIRLHIDTRRTR